MGAAMYGGRWNSIGNFMLYTAQTSSLSILEHLVHIMGATTSDYILSQIELKDNLIEELNAPLPNNWKQEKITSEIGDQWIKSKTSPILKVQSVINPLESNFLINPNHPNLNIEIVNQDWYVYDHRLVRSGS